MPLVDSTFRFGPFLLDLRAAELHANGTKTKIPEQPFLVLSALLEHPGEVVTREELRQRLWPADTFVDFDHSLNAAVKRLREALGDSADTPRFIETLPRHGYRFIAKVEASVQAAHVTAPQRLSSKKRWPLYALALLIAVAALWFWVVSSRNTESRQPPGEPLPVAVYHGDAGEPALSPDGDRIAFIAGADDDFGIYTALVGGENSVRLTNNPGDWFPAWSPDGRQIAFYRYDDDGLGIYTIPALGGTEHRVYQGPANTWKPGSGLAWSPDGETIAFTEHNKDKIHSRIALLSLGDFTVRPLTTPDDNHQDLAPSYSPDGSAVVFERDNIAGSTADFFVVSVKGSKPRRITSDARNKAGAAWSSDGKEIIFATWPALSGGRLWRVPLSEGVPTLIPGVGAGAIRPSISRTGHRLAYQQTFTKQSIWRLDLKDHKHAKGAPSLLIAEAGSMMRPHFSPDGGRIAFESARLGYPEIWVSDANGSNSKQMTSLHRLAGAPQWSPDGRYIAFEFHPGEQSEVYVLDVASGQARLLPTNPGWDNLAPGWSRDGKWLYFGSRRGAGPLRFQLWKVTLNGGSPIQVTKNGGLQALESLDGRFLYYTKYDVPGIWKMPVGGGQETLVIRDFNSILFRNWTVSAKGIYIISFKTHSQGTIEFFDFSTRTVTPLWDLEKAAGWGLTLSPDGQTLVYVQNDFNESQIMVVNNFR